MVVKEEPVYYLEVDFCKEVAALVYLSVMHNIDLHGLIYLWEKYGKDVFMFFYLFSGRDIKLQKAGKYERIMETAAKMREVVLDGESFNSSMTQEREVFSVMDRLFDGKDSLKVPVYA